jgi:uncharacterized membrane protein YkgB
MHREEKSRLQMHGEEKQPTPKNLTSSNSTYNVTKVLGLIEAALSKRYDTMASAIAFCLSILGRALVVAKVTGFGLATQLDEAETHVSGVHRASVTNGVIDVFSKICFSLSLPIHCLATRLDEAETHMSGVHRVSGAARCGCSLPV